MELNTPQSPPSPAASEPQPGSKAAGAIGTKPKLAAQAVISTGRSLHRAPDRTASRTETPAASFCLIELTGTTLFDIATPNSARKPIEAQRLRVHPPDPESRTPHASANGTLPTTSSASQPDVKVKCRSEPRSTRLLAGTLGSPSGSQFAKNRLARTAPIRLRLVPAPVAIARSACARASS